MVGWGEKTWRVGRPMTIVPPVLSDIRRQGRLTVVAPAGGEEHFGAPAPGFPEVAIRFVSRKAMRRIILDPRLGAAEAFMDGDLRIERGDIMALLPLLRLNAPWDPGSTPAARGTVGETIEIGRDKDRERV